MQFAVIYMKNNIKTAIRDYLSELRSTFIDKPKKSTVVCVCFLILFVSIPYTFSVYFKNPSTLDAFGMFFTFLKAVFITALSLLALMVLAFTIVHIYYQRYKDVRKRDRDKVIAAFKDTYDKETQLKIEWINQDKELQVKLLKEAYQKQLAEDRDRIKKEITKELYTDDYLRFQDIVKYCIEKRIEVAKLNARKVNVVITYALIEMYKFGFSEIEIGYIRNVLKCFIETNGVSKKVTNSPLKNKYKNDESRSRGRKKIQYTDDKILTKLDIEHFGWNIANYLDYKKEDVVVLMLGIFPDWFPDGTALSISKSLKISPNMGTIVIHEDLETYVKESLGTEKVF